MRNVIYCWFETDSHDWPLIYINLNLNSWLEMTNEEYQRKQNSNFVLFSPTPACTNQLFISYVSSVFPTFHHHSYNTRFGGKGLVLVLHQIPQNKAQMWDVFNKTILSHKNLHYFLLAINFLRRRPLNLLWDFWWDECRTSVCECSLFTIQGWLFFREGNY